ATRHTSRAALVHVHQQPAEAGGLPMSTATPTATPTTSEAPLKVVLISHSPLFYWWPVWAVGFLMAGLSFVGGYQVAFVPPGTAAERGRVIQGHEGPRDVLIVPKDQSLPADTDTEELKQPRRRMAVSNNPGIIWAMTLCLVILVTHVQLRGMRSVTALA